MPNSSSDLSDFGAQNPRQPSFDGQGSHRTNFDGQGSHRTNFDGQGSHRANFDGQGPRRADPGAPDSGRPDFAPRPRLRYAAHVEDAQGRIQPLEPEVFTVGGFLDATNLVLGKLFGRVAIRGEVSEFKINQNKWVFFNLKDAPLEDEAEAELFGESSVRAGESLISTGGQPAQATRQAVHLVARQAAPTGREKTISCFMPKFRLNTAIEDGMKVQVIGQAKLTDWGKFSFTVEAIVPLGQGSIKKSFDLLKERLTREGLFAPERKRPLPRPVQKIGVISSTAAAGYADFVKILNERWGGLKVLTAHTQVQGLPAVPQIVQALAYFNDHTDVDVIALIRGGGSADDLAIFNDERIVRAIVASKIPVITGIGHEVDESLADLAADVRASTPSNVAQLLTPDKRQLRDNILVKLAGLKREFLGAITAQENELAATRRDLRQQLDGQVRQLAQQLAQRQAAFRALNPELVLAKGYAILTGKLAPGELIEVQTLTQRATAEVRTVQTLKTQKGGKNG